MCANNGKTEVTFSNMDTKWKIHKNVTNQKNRYKVRFEVTSLIIKEKSHGDLILDPKSGQKKKTRSTKIAGTSKTEKRNMKMLVFWTCNNA